MRYEHSCPRFGLANAVRRRISSSRQRRFVMQVVNPALAQASHQKPRRRGEVDQSAGHSDYRAWLSTTSMLLSALR